MVRNPLFDCYIRGVMIPFYQTASQPLTLPTAQPGAPSSSSVTLWGDIPPAILGERQSVDLPLGPPSVSASELTLQLMNHAVFEQPLPPAASAIPQTGSLLSDPAPREWEPASGWSAAPSERGAKYALHYSRVSYALQAAMREWIPSLYFDRSDRFEDLDLAQGMIAWRASRPVVGEHVDRLSCDILDPEMMRRCFYWVERNIRPILSSLRPATEKLDSSRRSYYDVRNTNRILLRLRRAQRGFQMILKAEEEIITQLVKLVASSSKLRAKSKQQPRAVAIEVERSAQRTLSLVEARLRRIIPHGDVEMIMRMLIIVLTTTIEETQAEIAAKAA